MEFQARLKHNGIPAFIRRPRGRDIYAACGQLKRTVAVKTNPLLPVFPFLPDSP